jgi:DNA-binding transcriptional ArsR family regulator
MYLQRPHVPEETVFELLANARRRRSLSYLAEHKRTTVRELADAVAAAECTDEPTDATRSAVYVSLRQSHLPRLAEAGLVDFDSETNEVTVRSRARGATLYLELVTSYGLTWGEWYQYIGVAGLLCVLGSSLSLPGVSLVPTTLWATAGLAAFAVTGASQLLADRRATL